MQVEQSLHLREPRCGRKMRQVNGVHAQVPAAHLDDGFQRRALQAHRRPEARKLRQQVVAHGEQRHAGEQHVPELPPAAGAVLARTLSGEMEIDPRPVRPVVPGEPAGEETRLVDSTRPGPEALDFLERDQIRARDFPRDAIEVEASVPPAAVLDVVGDDPHRGNHPGGAAAGSNRPCRRSRTKSRRFDASGGNVPQPPSSSPLTASMNPSSSFARTTANRSRIDGGAFETTRACSAHSSMSRSL